MRAVNYIFDIFIMSRRIHSTHMACKIHTFVTILIATNYPYTHIIIFYHKFFPISSQSKHNFAAPVFTHAHAHELHYTSEQNPPFVHLSKNMSTPHCTIRQTASRMLLHVFTTHNWLTQLPMHLPCPISTKPLITHAPKLTHYSICILTGVANITWLCVALVDDRRILS